MVSLGDFRYKGRLFLTALTIRSIALGMFAASTAVWPSAAALLVLGAAQNAAGAIPAGALIGAAGGPLTAGVSAALTGAYESFWRSDGWACGMRDGRSALSARSARA